MTTYQMELAEALTLRAEARLPVLAGGTDFYPALQDAVPPSRVLDITRIRDMDKIIETESGWSLGAAVTWRHVLDQPLPPVFDALKSAASDVGSVQIQNAATLAGNLCNASPAADGMPPLLAMNARVTLASVRGERTLRLDEFVSGVRETQLTPDELLVSIQIPRMPSSAISAFHKLGARRYLVISIAMFAVIVVLDESTARGFRIDSARIAVGACSPVAKRLPALEQSLIGCTARAEIDACVRAATLSELSPIDDVRGSAGYRLQAVREMLVRSLAELCESARQ